MIFIQVIFWTFCATAVWAVFSIFIKNFQLLLGEGVAPVIIGICVAACLIVALWIVRSRIQTALRAIFAMAERIPTARWLWIVITIGTVLRIVWIWAVPVELASDGSHYFTLAARLAESQTYGGGQYGIAFWPPGFPFFLIPFVIVFGRAQLAVPVANLLLYFISVIAIYFLGKELRHRNAGKWAAAIMVFWPNSIFSSVVASKEMLLLTLITVSLLAFIHAMKRERPTGILSMAFLTGLLLGCATLVQPSFMLFPSALLIADLVSGDSMKWAFGRIVVVAFGLCLLVSPWTLRNYSMFGHVVPVSTNGGDAMYRANNPIATGGYMKEGAVDLSLLDELGRNRVGFQLATEWIKNNPGSFLLLAVKKQLLFLGDDAIGAYEALKRPLDINQAQYIILKAMSNAYWLLIWMMILLVFMLRGDAIARAEMVLPILSFLYLLGIDSVFESGGRHHIPVYGALAVLASLADVGSSRKRGHSPLRSPASESISKSP